MSVKGHIDVQVNKILIFLVFKAKYICIVQFCNLSNL